MTQDPVFSPDAAFYRYDRVKRAFDLCFSLAALTLGAVPMLAIAAAIRAETRGAPVFRQTRVGRGGKPFICYKFRTMRADAPRHCATGELDNADAYITRFGGFLRKTSLDELPQLFNILRGDMSLIGPRPLIPEEAEIHEARKKANVYLLRPGLTGNAQIHGRDLVTPEEKVRLDTEYLKNFSFRTDLKIFVSTVTQVLREKDIHEGKL